MARKPPDMASLSAPAFNLLAGGSKEAQFLLPERLDIPLAFAGGVVAALIKTIAGLPFKAEVTDEVHATGKTHEDLVLLLERSPDSAVCGPGEGFAVPVRSGLYRSPATERAAQCLSTEIIRITRVNRL
jgi:hypothetical protein